MPYKDPEEQRQYLKDYYEKRMSFVRQAKEKPCMDCGIQYPYYVMDFDHRNPEEKLSDINRLRWSASIARLAKEIEKCDVVCANCHRIRTFARQQAPLVE